MTVVCGGRVAARKIVGAEKRSGDAGNEGDRRWSVGGGKECKARGDERRHEARHHDANSRLPRYPRRACGRDQWRSGDTVTMTVSRPAGSKRTRATSNCSMTQLFVAR